MKKVITILLTLVIILTSSMAFAAAAGSDTEEINVTMDLALRPLGFAAAVMGSAIFIISFPIAAITDSIETTARVLIVEPVKFTFVRPIGEIGSGYSY
jgi:hypothetical protein